ncbi:MAG: toll/interleukin-1 receptor domain-containing protein [Oscillospiraceae bacterium]|nr:toll/interleukin-1 receptor domain-containing protein [Oscillospiraceae bacterium]
MDTGFKIFISYSHQDNACAKGVAKYLDRNGYDVWIDSEQLVLGGEWATDIDLALNTSNAVIAILSSNSVRRAEVLREISLAMKRMDDEKNDKKGFRIYFVVVGDVHPSWFRGNKSNKEVQKIIAYLSKHQFIRLSARGEITRSAMRELSTVLNAYGIVNRVSDCFNKNIEEKYEYIYENGIPEKVYDDIGKNHYYKVRPNDLAPSTVFPFALDNQWLPEHIMVKDSELRKEFLFSGFASDRIKAFMIEYQKENFYLSLFHSRQIIVNRASLLNSICLQKLYIADVNEKDKNFWRKERETFRKLLRTGVVVVFLYGDNETSPFVNKLPKYATEAKATKAWNRVCKQNAVYCIREDWDNPIDQHSIDFLRYCTTISINKDENTMLASNFGFDHAKSAEFLRTIKDIEMQVYCQTNMFGTSTISKSKGYSRSAFYKNYVVRDRAGKNDPVLNCLFDEDKPFCTNLKKMIDVFYNSIFSNYFKCWALMPYDTKPEDMFIYKMYLHSGDKEVSLEELIYAFSELLEHNSISELIKTMGNRIYLHNWTLADIYMFRKTEEWHTYVELLEHINKRASTWKVDFSEVDLLVNRFVDCIIKSPESEVGKIRNEDIAYSFRICIGSKVVDVVCSSKINRVKQYIGTYNTNGQNTLNIQFQIGDLSVNDSQKNIFMPVVLFDGKTDYSGGEAFFKGFCDFLIEQYKFVWVNT